MTVATTLFSSMLACSRFLLFSFLFFIFTETEVGYSQSAAVRFSTGPQLEKMNMRDC